MTQALPAQRPSEARGHRNVRRTIALTGWVPRKRPWTVVHQVAAAAWVHSRAGTPGSDSCPGPRGNSLQIERGLPHPFFPSAKHSQACPGSVILSAGQRPSTVSHLYNVRSVLSQCHLLQGAFLDSLTKNRSFCCCITQDCHLSAFMSGSLLPCKLIQGRGPGFLIPRSFLTPLHYCATPNPPEEQVGSEGKHSFLSFSRN